MRKVIILFFLFIFSPCRAAEDSQGILQQIRNMEQASLVVRSESGFQQKIRADLPLIPASTLKLLTALLALETWGSDHRFVTDFYLDENSCLWIKGYGDPFLISEELDLIVAALKKKGLRKVSAIGIDDSYFSGDIRVDGQSQTDNPYDASLSALAANFNTLNIIKDKNGIRSAEAQTPLIPLMELLGRKLGHGTHRVNLGKQKLSSRYFAELLAAKLRAVDIPVTKQLITGTFPNTISPYYRHQNSHYLAEIISAMLQYSNNFIANQLFLLLGIEAQGAPASMEKSRTIVDKKIQIMFGWKNHIIREGAGLSRDNRLSARQLTDILERFQPYQDLLSHQNDHILAKSGTLKGISTYAGYLQKNHEWIPFVIMINQPVEYNFRKRVAKYLLK